MAVARLDYDRILVTGAAGYLGRLVRASLRGRVPHVRLTDIAPMDPAVGGEELYPCDLADAAGIARALEGVDAVVHLGASLNVDDWPQTLSINIAGTYNVFEAARRAGTRRVVYASSHHAVGMYPVTEQIGIDVPLRPDSLYGLSKGCGEKLARYCWDQFGLGRLQRGLRHVGQRRDLVGQCGRCASALRARRQGGAAGWRHSRGAGLSPAGRQARGPRVAGR